jgi:hypothetical protein
VPIRETQSSSSTPPTLVVCDDDDMIIRLRDYLVRAGVETRATRRLADAWVRPANECIVLLPDDFSAGEVTDGLVQLLSRASSPLVIVITAGPPLYEPLIESLGNRESVVIMPKPVWGWTIVDLLRQWTGNRA